MRSSLSTALLSLTVGLSVGCDSSAQPPEKAEVPAEAHAAEPPLASPASEPAEGAVHAEAPEQVEDSPSPTEAATVTLKGTLSYKPAKRGVKSVAAFTGDELFLETEDGRKVVLQPSEAHSKDSLAALDGAQVEIEAEETEGELPDPRESYPTGADGQPMRRNAGFIVRALRTL